MFIADGEKTASFTNTHTHTNKYDIKDWHNDSTQRTDHLYKQRSIIRNKERIAFITSPPANIIHISTQKSKSNQQNSARLHFNRKTMCLALTTAIGKWR